MSLGIPLVKGDSDDIFFYVEDDAGAVNCTGATAVFTLKPKKEGSTAVAISATWVDAAIGYGKARVTSAAKPVAGFYDAEIVVAFASGATPKTYPVNGPVPVVVRKNIS